AFARDIFALTLDIFAPHRILLALALVILALTPDILALTLDIFAPSRILLAHVLVYAYSVILHKYLRIKNQECVFTHSGLKTFMLFCFSLPSLRHQWLTLLVQLQA